MQNSCERQFRCGLEAHALVRSLSVFFWSIAVEWNTDDETIEKAYEALNQRATAEEREWKQINEANRVYGAADVYLVKCNNYWRLSTQPHRK